MIKGLIISALIAGASVLLGILTLGIPGALLFELSSPLLRLIFGADAINRLPPDSMWPIAIYMTLFWPISIVIGYALVAWLFRELPRLGQIGVIALTVFGWSAALSVSFYMMARKG
jgi:hypothetical protein